MWAAAAERRTATVPMPVLTCWRVLDAGVAGRLAAEEEEEMIAGCLWRVDGVVLALVGEVLRAER